MKEVEKEQHSAVMSSGKERSTGFAMAGDVFMALSRTAYVGMGWRS
jgi:hypothetical protein